MHPLVSDLSNLKDAELDAKIAELSNKYFMVQNPDVKNQIVMLLDSYREELGKRRQAAMSKMMNNRDKGLDKLINVS